MYLYFVSLFASLFSFVAIFLSLHHPFFVLFCLHMVKLMPRACICECRGVAWLVSLDGDKRDGVEVNSKFLCVRSQPQKRTNLVTVLMLFCIESSNSLPEVRKVVRTILSVIYIRCRKTRRGKFWARLIGINRHVYFVSFRLPCFLFCFPSMTDL